MRWKQTHFAPFEEAAFAVLGGIVDTRHVGPLDDFALRNGPEVHLVWLSGKMRHFRPKIDIVIMSLMSQ
jgi:hypothetical protein